VVSLFTPGPPVLAGVDAVLRTLTTEALKGLATPAGVSVGPLDRPVAGPRLNWFLYRVEPALGHVNMEPPQIGWTTRRGHPPLALSLHYLLTADAGELSETGAEDDVVHAALSALMSALHDNGIFGAQSAIATGPDRSVAEVAAALTDLVEPLRITLDPVPMETITALWNTGSHALRLSVGYQISLVTVPAQVPFVAGPPVRTRVVGVAPSLMPIVCSVQPQNVSFDQPIRLQVRGITDTFRITLGRLPGDPDDPTDGRPNPAHTHSTGPWTLPASGGPDGLTTHLPNGELAPGPRPVVVTNLADGLPAGSGHAVVTVIPQVVSAAGLLHAGSAATLTVRHVSGHGEVFFGATSVAYTILGPDSIRALVPPLPPGPTVPVSLRVGTRSGPATDLAVGP
jgi:Pvc16 N-terminal domain